MITASHNPREYNGMKLVRQQSRPISSDTGLKDIEERVLSGDFPAMASQKGAVEQVDIMQPYVEHLLTYVDVAALKPLKVVVNAGNGVAGPILDALEKHLPFEFIKVHHEPDGSFPNGVPNPILLENREATSRVVRSMALLPGLPGTGILTAALCLMNRAALSKATIWSAFSVRRFTKAAGIKDHL